MQWRSEQIHLRRGGTSVLLDTTTDGLPAIVHWGPDLGEISPAVARSLAVAARPQRVSGGIDIPARLTLLPQEAFGWQGTPGLTGHRGGRDFSPALATTGIEETEHGVVVTATDAASGLALSIELELGASGLLRQRLTLRNIGEGDYELQELAATFPVPATARELLDTTGRHLKERSPQRHAFAIGSHVRESRRGRPGADASLLLVAGTPGFGFRRGTAHAVHPAWSGNHRILAERTVTGEAFLAAGELLLPGEVSLAPGGEYQTPWAIGSWGEGLDALAARFHDELRARPQHPSSPRPVTLNTWEAVYFDHDFARLSALADRAAAIGVERFVLDDGWFLGRRDDTAGLGDWYVDEAVWPDGLGPLIDRVRAHGMEFGLWFEPEMVNPDSELARDHPDWILHVGDRWPVPARQQQVLNLAHPDAFAYLLERIDAILSEYDIAYVKWDHNRDLLDAADARSQRPAVRETTLALYRLLDELKRRHPGVEIESCASGGARVDLGILERTDRVWTSDCIDPIERLDIQRYTNLLVPYELLGAHISGPRSHSTHRAHELSLRAGIALFGHLGIEWDVSTIDEAETAALAAWVAAYKEHRGLFHSGRSVNADSPDASVDIRGIVAADGGSAVYALTQREASVGHPVGRVPLPGLEPDSEYHVAVLEPAVLDGPGQSALDWAADGIVLTGTALETAGIQSPVLYPESLVLIQAKRV